MLAVMLLLAGGVLTTGDVMRGLSNEAIASIILLILMTSALRKNLPLETWLDRVLDRGFSYRGFLARMTTQVAVISSLINNTPVVALLTPYVFNWGKKNNISPSKLLIPLSYATILGGMITLIGTSTTLVLNGFLIENNLVTINPVHLLVIGGSVTIAGLLFLIIFSQRLLPDHKDILDQFQKNRRDYLIETELTSDSPLIGLNLLEAGLRNLRGVYLVEIIRNGKSMSPVGPAEIIQEHDRLIFAGDTSDIMDLVDKKNGLELPRHELSGNDKVDLNEVVVGANSSIIGKTVKDARFRERYDAGIIAIQRGGRKLEGKIGDIVLRNGDLLLLMSGSQFREKMDMYRDLYLINHVKEISKLSAFQRFGILAMLGTIVAILATGSGLFVSLLAGFSVMILFRLINLTDIKRELDLELIAILILSLALGKALVTTGLGDVAGHFIISVFQPFGEPGILFGLLIGATLLTSLISNVATISIMFPIALAICQQTSYSEAAIFLAIAFGSSSAFLTPIGYQTNLIIYGPGGYRFNDFMRIGLPMTIIYSAVVLAFLLFLF